MTTLGRCLILFYSLITVTSAAATDLRGAFGQEKPPYIWIEGGVVRGIELDIVRAALAPLGYHVEATALPNKRLISTFSSAEFDFAAGLQPTDVTNAFYSDAYLEYQNYAITKEAKNIHLSSVADLFNYHVALWQNGYLDLGLDHIRPLDPKIGLPDGFSEFATQDRENKFFWSDRADVVIIDRNIFLWYAKLLSAEMDTSAPVVFHDILGPHIRVRIAFHDRKLRDDFNQGLKDIMTNGGYQAIMARYTMTMENPLLRSSGEGPGKR